MSRRSRKGRLLDVVSFDFAHCQSGNVVDGEVPIASSIPREGPGSSRWLPLRRSPELGDRPQPVRADLWSRTPASVTHHREPPEGGGEAAQLLGEHAVVVWPSGGGRRCSAADNGRSSRCYFSRLESLEAPSGKTADGSNQRREATVKVREPSSFTADHPPPSGFACVIDLAGVRDGSA
jgi:hypothetical protein